MCKIWIVNEFLCYSVCDNVNKNIKNIQQVHIYTYWLTNVVKIGKSVLLLFSILVCLYTECVASHPAYVDIIINSYKLLQGIESVF